MLSFWRLLHHFGLFSIRNEALPPDPHRVSAESRADGDTKGAGDGNADKASGGKKNDLPREDANLESTVDSGAVNGGGDAEMFANMFETAVSMAAEAVQQQLGGGDISQEEDYDERKEEEDHEALSPNEKEDCDKDG